MRGTKRSAVSQDQPQFPAPRSPVTIDPHEGPLFESLSRRFDDSELGILSSDLKTKLTYCNPAFSEMVGLRSETLLGKRTPYPWFPKKSARLRSAIFRAGCPLVPKIVEWVGAFTVSHEILDADRQPIRVRVTIDALVDTRKAPLGILSSFTEEEPSDEPVSTLAQPEWARLDERLSAREREILRAFLQGLRVSAIATRYRISPNTVRNHLKSIYSKCGVHSQQELLLAVIQGTRTSYLNLKY